MKDLGINAVELMPVHAFVDDKFMLDRGLLGGDAMDEGDERGEPVVGDTLLILMNAHREAIPFHLPRVRRGTTWEMLVDTSCAESEDQRANLSGAEE